MNPTWPRVALLRLTQRLLPVLVAAPAVAQRPTTAADARRTVSALAADSMEGRGTGTSTMGDSLAAKGIPIIADPRPSQEFFWRADNFAFARRGIVAHTISSFSLHGDYHRPSDEIGTVDFEHTATVINEVTRAVLLLANGPAPQWKPGGKP